MISPRDAFAPLRAALERAGVRYAVGGSWASTAFGEPRFTNDVDILADTGLSEEAAPFVTAEDILLAKLDWFRAGGEVSEVQWRDIQGIVRSRGKALDLEYLEMSAAKLGILALLNRALTAGPESTLPACL